jgi:hypothetical protein
MHFRRPGRQRRYLRFNKPRYWSFLRKVSYLSQQTGIVKCARQGGRSRFVVGGKLYVSQLHNIRYKSLFPSEKELINLYFCSQEDLYMREKIAAYCSAEPRLQHITTDYLDRLAKLKIFL